MCTILTFNKRLEPEPSPNGACAQWDMITVPELAHRGKYLFKNAAEWK